jgi:pimeloyl-ACP methyl ester carboxylesterase
VHGLVVIDGGGFQARTPPTLAFCSLMSRQRFLRAFYPTFARLYMRPRSDADRAALTAAVATTRAAPGLKAVSGLWRSFASPEHDLRADAARIATPTLVVWGRRDPVIPLRAGRRVTETIPGARLEVFDSGHLPYTTDPQRFAALLAEFVKPLLEASHDVLRS